MYIVCYDLELGPTQKTHTRLITEWCAFAWHKGGEPKCIFDRKETEPSLQRNSTLASEFFRSVTRESGGSPIMLVAHNGFSCDHKIQHYSMVRAGLAWPSTTQYVCSRKIASVLVTRTAMLRVVGNKQFSMANLYFLLCKTPLLNAHTARADAHALACVWKAWGHDVERALPGATWDTPKFLAKQDSSLVAEKPKRWLDSKVCTPQPDGKTRVTVGDCTVLVAAPHPTDADVLVELYLAGCLSVMRIADP